MINVFFSGPGKISLIAVSFVFFCFAATPLRASPAALQLCVNVLSDGDINANEGGVWEWVVSDQRGGIKASADLNVNRTESDKSRSPSCATLPLPEGVLSLKIHSLSPRTFEWSGDAFGFPRWRVTAEAVEKVLMQGVGRDVVITPEVLGMLSVESVVSVTFVHQDRWVESDF